MTVTGCRDDVTKASVIIKTVGGKMYVNKDLLFDSELPLEQIRQFGEIFPEGCKVNQENLLQLIDHEIRVDLLLGRFLSTEDRKTVTTRQTAIEELDYVRNQRFSGSYLQGADKERLVAIMDDGIADIKHEIVEIVMKIASI